LFAAWTQEVDSSLTSLNKKRKSGAASRLQVVEAKAAEVQEMRSSVEKAMSKMERSLNNYFLNLSKANEEYEGKFYF
jgi:hypothetical protein